MSYDVTEQVRAALATMAATPATPQVRVVDASAPPDGDGSWSKPYNNIYRALVLRPEITADPATWDYTIFVMPGTYEVATDYTFHGGTSFIALGPVRWDSAWTNFRFDRTTWTDWARLSFSAFPAPSLNMGAEPTPDLSPMPCWQGPTFLIFGPSSGDFSISLNLHRWQNMASRSVIMRNIQNNQLVHLTVRDSDLGSIEFSSEYGYAGGSITLERSSLATIFKAGAGLINTDVMFDWSTIKAPLTVYANCLIRARNSSFVGPLEGLVEHHFRAEGSKFEEIHGCRFERVLIDGFGSGETFGPFVDTVFTGCEPHMFARIDGVTSWWFQNGGNNISSLITVAVTETATPP